MTTNPAYHLKHLFFGLLLILFYSCDKCKDVECLNDGVCNEGICDCPIGYEFSDCSAQIKPKAISILQVEYKVKEKDVIRAFDDAVGIDSLPDIGLGILTGTERGYTFISPEQFENSIQTSYLFKEGFPYQIEDGYQHIRFGLVDWDGEHNGIEIFWFILRLYTPDNDFPEYVEYDTGTGRSIKVWLSYTHRYD